MELYVLCAMAKLWPVKYFRCLPVLTLAFIFSFPLFISCENGYPNAMDRLELVFGEDFEKNNTHIASSTYMISPTKYPILRPKSSPDNETTEIFDYDEALEILEDKKIYFDSEYDEWDTQSDAPYEKPKVTTENTVESTKLDKMGTFLPSDKVRGCPLDNCPVKTEDGTTTQKPVFGKIRPEQIDFRRNPYFCRCDESCHIYGDCCWNVVDKLNINNSWRCNRLQHEKTWVLMVSTCNQDSKPDLHEMCTTPESISPSNYTYHLDIPVYSHFTKKIYKNIYCAYCNGITLNEILYMEKKMLCSKEMDSITLETFIKRAHYYPGQRYWNDLDIYCGIYVTEFESTRVEATIPDIRFCVESVDYCPDNSDERTINLCSSYIQHVITRFTETKLFKNHHCAACHIEAMEEQHSSKRSTRCHIFGESDTDTPSSCPHGIHNCSRIVPPGGEAKIDSTGGISLLFDFTFAFERESYVGYEMKCKEDEVWDFLHQKCHPIMCPKDHILENKVCIEIIVEKENLLNSSIGNDVGVHVNTSQSENVEDLVRKCYTILLHDNEYEVMDNETIVFNKTISGVQTQLKFSKNEYERWNNTTVSVCAQDLHLGFKTKFSKELNYVSLVALGTSVVSSLIHMILYISLPKLRNLPGQNLVCLTLSLFISQLIFLTLIEHQNRGLCICAAIIMHYFFLASFFWMNIMSFDIWRTFSSEFLVKRQSNDSTRTFVKYSIIAWISPALIVFVAVIIDFIVADDLSDQSTLRSMVNMVQPLYGHNNLCWINQGLSLLLFFALPVALIMLANLVLFLLTAQSILRQHREANRVLKSGDSRAVSVNNRNIAPSSTSAKKSNEILVKLYWKLALIMGLTWILGFVANSTGWTEFWYLFVFFNGSQGTFIFLAFDLKPKVWNMVKECIGFKREVRESSSDMKRRGTATSTTSAGFGTSNIVIRNPQV